MKKKCILNTDIPAGPRGRQMIEGFGPMDLSSTVFEELGIRMDGQTPVYLMVYTYPEGRGEEVFVSDKPFTREQLEQEIQIHIKEYLE
jgi:hypothetical protein